MTPSVVVSSVSKSFGKKLVLNNVNLSINKGQIYGLIGPSGSGKTTLVKIIVGMEAPDKGTIKMLNKNVPDLELLQNIGYMAQSDALYTELTAQENLKFYASLFKLNKKTMENRISYVINMVNLNNDLSKKVSTYSGGMKRRLSLAIALIQNPEILILDEPTVGIDPELRLNIWNELLRLKNEENKTIIVTTHAMDEAKKCDFLAMVRHGVILADGTPSELMKYYKANDLDEVFLKAGRKKI
ncbi:ABC transporter family protein [Clostridium sporogenes]|uniref:ABC transporter ATP-binding protein n=1 Tax=Clostridium TaxID=1485 RepID=UPI0005F92D19|nr:MULTISPECIES: ABC transporter ATP-binding protein [Clostridium]APF25543.1 ABC transporter family protein [Clostridium sporogenes]MDI6918252.1 ABC transporter ATP-binding protein [Clostridium botulinum]WMU98349.1 ABC transporter ATP-binding protein [Clostridium botulinum]